MQIGFVSTPGDPRSPISAETLKKYLNLNASINLERGLGDPTHMYFDDSDQVSNLSRDEVLQRSDIIYSHGPISKGDLSHVKPDAVLISFYAPFNADNELATLEGQRVNAFSMDMIPRTTLAQSMDVLSSMASIAGYKAVLTAATELPRYFPMMMTAAGTVKPATVVVLGAGVAGLQAIATARKLGAIVEAFDVRPAVKQEVESLGARFIEVEGATDDKAAGGYAVEQTEDYKRRQQEKIEERVSKADVVITTAQLRGRPAPTLVTEKMVESMKFGSVIVDLASSTGGNCACTVDGTITTHKGVKIVGDSYLANSALIDASSLLSNNICNYLSLFVKDGEVNLDMENEIIARSMVYPPQKND